MKLEDWGETADDKTCEPGQVTPHFGHQVVKLHQGAMKPSVEEQQLAVNSSYQGTRTWS